MNQKITQSEFNEYLKIKEQLDLVKKVENVIYNASWDIERKKGFDPDFEDVERNVLIKEGKIKVQVVADFEEYVFDIPTNEVIMDWREENR
jgi:hypothetical protein